MQKEADILRAKVQESIVLLQMGMTIFSHKRNEATARERADELCKRNEAFARERAAELSERIDSAAETVAERIEVTLRREAQLAAERKAEDEARLAQELQRKVSEASADTLQQLYEDQVKQQAAAQTLVRDALPTVAEENKTTRAKLVGLEGILSRLSAPFVRVAEEGAKVHEVRSSP